MTLSIIITHFRTKGLLKYCLRSIRAAQISIPYEVIVVDNDSRDGSVEMMIKDFPEVRCLANLVNLGFGRANNLGMTQAQGKYFLILNPDTCVIPGSIERVINYMESHPETGVAGARLLNPDRTVQVSAYRFAKAHTPIIRRSFLKRLKFGRRETDRFTMSDWDRGDTRPVDWVQGSFMCMRADRLAEVGGFDDRFFMYFEDMDLCRRFALAGYPVVYLHDAPFIHYHRRESDGGGVVSTVRRKTGRYHIASWLRYVWKWKGK